jgi:hypothetical protein
LQTGDEFGLAPSIALKPLSSIKGNQEEESGFFIIDGGTQGVVQEVVIP